MNSKKILQNTVKKQDDKAEREGKAEYHMQKDPVCLMDVDDKAMFKIEYEGKAYYFCSEFCLEKFKKNPKDYLLRHRDKLDI